MTYKEKALDRIKEMYAIRSSSASDITWYFAKQSALIAIQNEIALLEYILQEQAINSERVCGLTKHMVSELMCVRDEIEQYTNK